MVVNCLFTKQFMKKEYESLDAFYKEYFLVGHKHKYTKLFHFVAIGGAIILGVIFFITFYFRFLLAAFAVGYGISFASHYLFEKNEPASYSYPVYGFLCAFRLFFEILIGRQRIL